MPELESVISGAIESAGLEIGDGAGDSNDVVQDDAPVDESPVGDADGDAPAVDAAADGDEGKPAGETPVEGAVVEGQQGRKAGPIPFDKHKTILENARTQHEAEIAPLREQVSRLSSELETFQEERTAYGLADSNPDLFVKVMLEDPKIGALIRQTLGTAAPAAQEKVEPKADVLNDDGTVGYSPEAMQRIIEQQAVTLQEKFNAMLQEKFGLVEPLVQEHQAGKAFEAARVKMSSVVEDARNTWPGFKDNESEIKAFLGAKGNERVTLEQAYRKVVMPKFQSTEDQIRAKVLKELEGREAAVQSVRTPTPRAPRPEGGKRSTEDIIRQSIADKGLAI